MFNLRGFPHPSCPTSIEIHSGRADRPCRRENTLHSPYSPEPCAFENQCRSLDIALYPIDNAYERPIQVTLSERSASIVVRAEQQFHHREKHRLTLRKHFCELIEGPSYPDKRGLVCRDFAPNNKYGNYLGFVDLRTAKDNPCEGSPIAMGVLAPPSQFRNGSDSIIITAPYGPLFGGPSFKSSIYAMQDPESGSYCAQASISMAVGMLCDRGARMKGQSTITFLGNPRTRVGEVSPVCLASTMNRSRIAQFSVTGMTPFQCLNALRTQSNGVSARLVWVRKSEYQLPDLLIDRIIRANVAARFPVIFFVDAIEWYNEGNPERFPNPAHAVVLIGYKKIPLPQAFRNGAIVDEHRAPHEIEYIAHDPGAQPFLIKERFEALKSAWAFQKPPIVGGRVENELFFIPVADCRVSVHLDECVRFLMGYKFRNIDRIEPSVVSWGDDPVAKQCIERFCEFVQGLNSDCDITMKLVDRTDLAHEYAAPEQRNGIGKCLSDAFETKFSGNRYWCIACYRNGELGALFAFDAEYRLTNEEVYNPGWYSLGIAFLIERDNINWRLDWLLKPLAIPNNQRVAAHGKTPRVDFSLKKSVPLDLRSCVLSSSSNRPLRELIADLNQLSGVTRFEAFLLRDIDIREWFTDRGEVTPSELMSDRSNVEIIVDRLVAAIEPFDDVRYACLATFFPDISSANDKEREIAIKCLVNSILVASDLVRNGKMDFPRVEAVVGSTIDVCPCMDCRKAKRCFHSLPEDKQSILIDSLQRVVRRVKTEGVPEFAICLEVEPGESYILNGAEAIDRLFAEIEEDDELKDSIFLNLDVMHMMNCTVPVEANDLERWVHRIGHSHVCDQPSMHTIDQPMGTHTPISQIESEYLPYFRLLRSASEGRSKRFSKCISIELESNDRSEFINRSVGAVRNLRAMASRI
jgi:sugar phosphate isomerase/epimerase